MIINACNLNDYIATHQQLFVNNFELHRSS